MNEKYSYKDFTNQQFVNAEDIDGEIIGSCFYQEGGMKEVFPSGLNGVTFKNCNLDNCIIPAGNTIDGGTNKEIISQNDREDWICNKGQPIEPLQKEKYEELKISIDPIDIPSNEVEIPILKDEERKKLDIIKQGEVSAIDQAKIDYYNNLKVDR